MPPREARWRDRPLSRVFLCTRHPPRRPCFPRPRSPHSGCGTEFLEPEVMAGTSRQPSAACSVPSPCFVLILPLPPSRALLPCLPSLPLRFSPPGRRTFWFELTGTEAHGADIPSRGWGVGGEGALGGEQGCRPRQAGGAGDSGLRVEGAGGCGAWGVGSVGRSLCLRFRPESVLAGHVAQRPRRQAKEGQEEEAAPAGAQDGAWRYLARTQDGTVKLCKELGAPEQR